MLVVGWLYFFVVDEWVVSFVYYLLYLLYVEGGVFVMLVVKVSLVLLEVIWVDLGLCFEGEWLFVVDV